MSIGVNIKIDVTKIDKELLVKGKKGTYLDATVFINPDEADQYGNHGMVTQAVSKEAREAGEKGNILGNAKVFWQDSGIKRDQPQYSKGVNDKTQSGNDKTQGGFDNFDSDVPF